MSLGLENGTIFAGRYVVLGRIAEGGMGTVYEVMHVETERRRALKVMHPQILKSADLRERFRREARVAARVDSEFIVDVFDAGVDESTGMPFLVMELLRGEELGERLTRTGRLPPNEAVAYLQQTALALDKTHRASIVHRDLKPENLFLTFREDGPPRVKVLDFGVAKLLAGTVSTTMGRKSMGTPLYMSPEQWNPDIQLTGAADIYSLGMMAYTLLVGTAYWEEEAQRAASLLVLATILVNGPKELPTNRAARAGVRLPVAFNPWFARATAVNPAVRFATATAAVSALADALGLAVTQGSIPPEQVEVLPGDARHASEAVTVPLERRAGTRPPQTATSTFTSITAWRAEQRMGSILVVAMVVGCMILSAALFFWWKHRVSLSHSAVTTPSALPAVSPPPSPSSSSSSSSSPPPSLLPEPTLATSSPSLELLAPAPSDPAAEELRGSDAPAEPSASAASPEPLRRPSRRAPSRRPRVVPKPKRYSQD